MPVKEYDTSRTCWRCGSQNTSREMQGRVECDDCELEDNADKNGASNIGNRAIGKDIQSPLSTVGAVVAQSGRRSHSRDPAAGWNLRTPQAARA